MLRMLANTAATPPPQLSSAASRCRCAAAMASTAMASCADANFAELLLPRLAGSESEVRCPLLWRAESTLGDLHDFARGVAVASPLSASASASACGAAAPHCRLPPLPRGCSCGWLPWPCDGG